MTAETVTTQSWVVIPIGRTAREIFFCQLEALTRSVINVEFLQSFLRRHFRGGETNGSVPKCQVFAQTRPMYDIYFSSLKIFHLHFFAWLRNYFFLCVCVFFGIGRKQLKLEVWRIDWCWQCDALAWFTNSATTTLRCWNTHALGQVRKEKKSLVLFVTSTILRSKSMHFWANDAFVLQQKSGTRASQFHLRHSIMYIMKY